MYMTENKKQKMSWKYHGFLFLWIIVGYIISEFQIRIFHPYSVDFSIGVISLLKKYEIFEGASIVVELILYFFSYFSHVISVFIGALFLSLATGVRKFWALGFIFATIALGFYVVIEPILISPYSHSDMPKYIFRPFIAGMAAYLLVIPLVVWSGCFMGNLIRKKYA
jgi:hypothetical protein